MELVERLRAEANACEVAALALVGRSKARMLHRARLFTEAADILEEALKALADIEQASKEALTSNADEYSSLAEIETIAHAILTKSQGEKTGAD